MSLKPDWPKGYFRRGAALRALLRFFDAKEAGGGGRAGQAKDEMRVMAGERTPQSSCRRYSSLPHMPHGVTHGQCFEKGLKLEPDNTAMAAALVELKKMKLTDGPLRARGLPAACRAGRSLCLLAAAHALVAPGQQRQQR